MIRVFSLAREAADRGLPPWWVSATRTVPFAVAAMVGALAPPLERARDRPSAGRNATGSRSAFGVTFVGLLAILGTLLLAWTVSFSLHLVADGRTSDWRVLVEAGRRAGNPTLYALWDEAPYRWSPLCAWLLVPLGAIGPHAWTLLHVGAAVAFRSWRITAVMLLSWPFWFDAVNGNVLTFVVLAAWWALKGNRFGVFAFLAMALLMPRPLMVPLVAWILWKQADWRLPFVAMFLVHMGVVLWTGMGDEWLRILTTTGDEMLNHRSNMGPSAIVGAIWLPIGLVLGAWFLWRGRIGLASLAVSPYLLPYYYLFVLLDLPRLSNEIRHVTRSLWHRI